jgi:hypothetical protein
MFAFLPWIKKEPSQAVDACAIAVDLQSECRRLEAVMSETEKQKAFSIMRANGWRSGEQAPAWVWRDVFREVLKESDRQPHKPN